MPLGLVSNDQFEHELRSHVLIYVDLPNKGRPEGKEEVPEVVRELIASESIAGASPTELIEAFGTSRSSISAYKNGATSTSTYHKQDESLVRAINTTRDNIIGPAQARLLQAIEAITPSKLEDAKVNMASAVARDMSSIIKNLTPDSTVQVQQNNVVIFKPRMKEEDDYEIISVNE